MEHIKTISSGELRRSMLEGGCGECAVSCQSACKTSCTVGNQSCERDDSPVQE
ncbi:MAG: six-cysteine ranthipeptide SCIFF [Lachnospiraceae bacterium]|jgi:predicted ribosomally synthesized six-cysteine peptide SCIFF|nr:six-cysteine ranthipeptide SCIFF [Lachnospiraceae bacterium]